MKTLIEAVCENCGFELGTSHYLVGERSLCGICFASQPLVGIQVETIQAGMQSDNVNSPPHYIQGGIECIDAIKASMSKEEYHGYLKGNCIKYLWRYKHKGGAESLAKADWYLQRLRGEMGE